MRLRLKIFSAAFIAIFTLLQVHPLFASWDVRTEKADCDKAVEDCEAMKKPVCAMNKCTLPIRSADNESCNSNGCNPFVPCSIGFCCYLVENVFSYSLSPILIRKKLSVINDNRLSGSLSECWHPPEMIS